MLTGALSGAGCADGDRLALAMAVLTLLGELGREHLVLCCVDDVHALDRPSLDVIAFVARRLRAHRVALLLAASAEPALSGVPLLPVRELDPRASRTMLADLLRGDEPDGPLTAHLLRGHVPDGPLPASPLGGDTLDGGPAGTSPALGCAAGLEALPGALDGDGGDGDPLAALAALGGGNPRALADLAASLTDSQRRGEAPLPTRLPADSALLRAYRARLDRLPSDTRWLLLLAAADEENDAAGLVRAALGSGVDIAALAPAEDAGLVRVGRGGIVFPQPLARTLAYEEAPLAQRRAAHLHLARTLDPDRERLRRAVHLAAAAYGPDARLAAELEDAAGDGGYSRASAALEHAAQLTTEPAGAASRLVTAARYAWQSGSPHRARSLLRRAHPGPETGPPPPRARCCPARSSCAPGPPSTPSSRCCRWPTGSPAPAASWPCWRCCGPARRSASPATTPATSRSPRGRRRCAVPATPPTWRWCSSTSPGSARRSSGATTGRCGRCGAPSTSAPRWTAPPRSPAPPRPRCCWPTTWARTGSPPARSRWPGTPATCPRCRSPWRWPPTPSTGWAGTTRPPPPACTGCAPRGPAGRATTPGTTRRCWRCSRPSGASASCPCAASATSRWRRAPGRPTVPRR
ncbi:hypothetical protein ACFQY4_08060 [Catellatospora bangladeshensis]|uniref:hypothetical protein n=1 Tax=Catellatospora bangladeshensis TaxID=310355 RepID=UPI003615F18D